MSGRKVKLIKDSIKVKLIKKNKPGVYLCILVDINSCIEDLFSTTELRKMTKLWEQEGQRGYCKCRPSAHLWGQGEAFAVLVSKLIQLVYLWHVIKRYYTWDIFYIYF